MALSTDSDIGEGIGLPGFGLPVNHMSQWWYSKWEADNILLERYPNAISDWAGEPITVREKNMMAMVNQITDKPEWRQKVFDETITAKWRTETVTDQGQGFTENMFEFCLAELQEKAKKHKDFVAILDSDVAVVKSDSMISTDLKEELQLAVKPLENIPDRLKDWHPGSGDKVLDLVHPSLFPLVYGRSRILRNGIVGLKDCVESCGKGEVVPVPQDDDARVQYLNASLRMSSLGNVKFWSKRFQWLPCSVQFADEEDVKITSYINNLHPVHHEHLYGIIEKFIAKSLPLWSQVLNSFLQGGHNRVPMACTEYEFPNGRQRPKEEGDVPGTVAYYEAQEQWYQDNRVLIKPDARDYSSRAQHVNVDLRKRFAEKGLQVIVKLANIHLTPEKPTYEGGTWHIEGQLNEHICATSLYYYDCENITNSYLAFRQKVNTDDINEKTYGQDDYQGVEYLFGIEQDGPGIQELGRISTSEGRLLAFPNVLQHQVQPFGLVDPTKPGHRKILALFLVDPFQRVISTANVPPQQKEWWTEVITEKSKLGELPAELMQYVVDDVEGFPISLEEAKNLRETLMDERKAFVQDVNQEYENEEFSFCEH